MIKKILFISALFSVGFASGQTFQLLDANDVDISNTTHYEYGAAGDLDDTKFHVKNLTSVSQNFASKVEVVYYNGDNLFSCNNLAVCFGAACYSGLASVSGVQIINNGIGDVVPANGIYTEFKVSPVTFCWNDCANDSAVWIVTVFDENNPSDEVTTTIVWRCGVDPVSVNEINEDAIKLSAYPNPSSRNLTIDYAVKGSSNSLELDVFDVLGKKVVSQKLNSNQGRVNLDVEFLNAGVYFYAIKVDGSVVKTERLIIK
ncbi:T9SS type A sorting domain-containing protein [Vicingaceae bacterium]|nr:T9SS type A sorting domain-containing protein [Vicingaceae bacterium]